MLTVIDHYHVLSPGQEEGALDADKVRVDLLLRLKNSSVSRAHPVGMPLLCLAKVPKGRGTSGFGPDDLHGSSALQYAADSILFLEEDPGREARDGVSPVAVRGAKGRGGATRGLVPLDFPYRECRFAEPGGADPAPKAAATVVGTLPGRKGGRK